MNNLTDEKLDMLVAYALGVLEPEEMARMGKLLEQDPELRAMLAELRATTGTIPYGLADVEPPPELRERVLAYATGRAQPRPTPVVAPRTRLRSWLFGLGGLAAASMVAAVLAFGQVGTLRNELADVQAQLDQQIALNQQVASVVTSNPETVALSGSGGSGTLMRDASGLLVLASTLPPPAEGHVYQLWVLADGENPVSAGVFTPNAENGGLVAISTSAPVTNVFAITEEPGPQGSPGPTTPILISNLDVS